MKFIAAVTLFLGLAGAAGAQTVQTANGKLDGVIDPSTSVRVFRGIPFAAPPVDDLRWKPPQPPANWEGIRKADTFGPRPMQLPLFNDMMFRSPPPSEDCLYLNVWTPAESNPKPLPVLVYFYGGGMVAGDASELRYDGGHMAARGMVVVTVNYRLGIFGFFVHPELTAESPNHASGNYGLLDQFAALQWVQQNIAAFGGDPKQVTIAGESAGSFSVSLLMSSPLSRMLFARAIGESGAAMGASLAVVPHEQIEKEYANFAGTIGATTLAQLRALPADKLLSDSNKHKIKSVLTVDGYFLTKLPIDTFAAGEQAHVPLLAGVNSQEQGPGKVLTRDAPTVENYQRAIERLFPHHADEIFKLYPATNEAEVLDSAQELGSDMFLSYPTWKWIDLATRTGGEPTYYYLFTHTRPRVIAAHQPRPSTTAAATSTAQLNPIGRGAVHSAEIEYALGNLDTNPRYAWDADDYTISAQMQSYFVNFIKSANPNGPGLVDWPMFSTNQRLIIDVTCKAAPTDKLNARYQSLEPILKSP